MAQGATRALEVLRLADVPHQVHEYDAGSHRDGHGDRRSGWGEAAAAALGVDPARIHKTLIASVDGRLVVAIVPVAAELDLKGLAAAAGGRRAVLADPLEAQRATGYVLGGISPLGQRRRLSTALDQAAEAWPTIFVSAGRRGLQVELRPADLAALTDATIAPIAAPRAGASLPSVK
ncbi:MAG TPA: aminoacyl-tRNA deacylase [Candidatus Limnocylindrales bacterium]|jgi:Cys-tRNA(Pro)/Cys-tRNA(Cys) deacylase|nr:aminoacyl-tRNA deacylase [Candidatus Limnocylindrales bacterium]